MTVPEIILIVSTISGIIGGAIAWLINFHSERRKENQAMSKIDVDTFKDMREQIKIMEKDIVDLRADRDKLREELDAQRERIEVLEGQIDVKDATIARLETRLNKILVYLKGLFKELNERGVQYTPPEKGLLDTDPNIKPVK